MKSVKSQSKHIMIIISLLWEGLITLNQFSGTSLGVLKRPHQSDALGCVPFGSWRWSSNTVFIPPGSALPSSTISH